MPHSKLVLQKTSEYHSWEMGSQSLNFLGALRWLGREKKQSFRFTSLPQYGNYQTCITPEGWVKVAQGNALGYFPPLL
jgi:hypothetical protein